MPATSFKFSYTNIEGKFRSLSFGEL